MARKSKTAASAKRKHPSTPRTQPPTSGTATRRVADPQGPNDAAITEARALWLRNLDVRFHTDAGSITLADVLEKFTKVGLREVADAMLDYDDVVDLIKVHMAGEIERQRRKSLGGFEGTEESPSDDGGASAAGAFHLNMTWDVGFALREWVIPSPGGIMPTIGGPDLGACWGELVRLAVADREKRLGLATLDPGVRARLELTDPATAKMPKSFTAAVDAVYWRFKGLFYGLARGLLGAEGLHPTTRERRQLEARTWNRANISIDLKSGDIVNQRTGEVEWFDVCLTAKASEVAAHEFMPAVEEPHKGGGRPVKYHWDGAIDAFLVNHIREAEFENIASLISSFREGFGKEEDAPEESWTRKEFNRRWPNFYKRTKEE